MNVKRKGKTIRGRLDDEAREKLHKAPKKRMETICESKKERRDKAFDNVKICCVIDPSILKSKACNITQQEYLSGIRKRPDYICNICHKWEYRETVIRLIKKLLENVTLRNGHVKLVKIA